MNTCRTCEHWDTTAQKTGGICDCVKLREPSWNSEPRAPDELVYSYDEGGAFWTGPEFGCVHHTARVLESC